MKQRVRLLGWLLALLWISGCATVPKQTMLCPAPPGAIYHVVGQGETLWRIARTYHVDVQELMRANHIARPTELALGQRLLIPGITPPGPVFAASRVSLGTIQAIVGPKQASSHWHSITIHHSATLEGNASVFDKNHRRRGMGGLFYHFVIGNGTGSADGEIEVGWRWKKQAQVARKNDIQVCLVGDFTCQHVSERQFASLFGLITVLRDEYGIPLGNIRRHQSIRGKHTACPGALFPFDRLITELRKEKP